MDEYVLQESNDLSGDNTFDIINRRSLTVYDSNLGSYSTGEILWDLSTIANSGSYIDWKNTFMQIPVALQVTHNFAKPDPNYYDALSVSLKNGNFAMLHSMSLNLSNQQVINLQPNIHARISYEIVNSMSKDDMERAIQFGYAWEEGDTFFYNDIADAAGVGNSVISVKPQDGLFGTYKQNTGRLRRLRSVLDSVSNEVTDMLDPSVLMKRNVSYVAERSDTRTTILLNCKIPLDIVHDYFKKCPLAKNSLYSMSVHINAPCTVQCTVQGLEPDAIDPDSKKYSMNPTISTPNNFCPLQLSSLEYEDGCSPTDENTTLITADLTIVNAKTGGFSTPMKSCSLVVSVVDLAATAQQAYLSNKIKEFSFDEVIVHRISKVSPGESVNQIITNNISRVRKFVMMPYLAGVAGSIPSALLNPFDSFGSGYLSSPFSSVVDFNVYVSGIPIFHNNLNTTAQFYNEFKSLTTNGGVSSAYQNSCLVSEDQYATQYGAIVADLSRHRESEDSLSKNISCQFQNNNENDMGYLIFVYYEKSIKVDAELGNIVL